MSDDYEYNAKQQAAQAGDEFMQAVRLAEEGKTDDALGELNRISEQGTPAYKALAKLRAASELSKKGDVKEALASYDAVANDGAADQNFRSIARLRAASLMVDEGVLADVETRVAPLLGPGGPYRGSAKEILALAQYKAGDLKKSAALFKEVKDGAGLPRALIQRATLMLELIASEGGPAAQE